MEIVFVYNPQSGSAPGKNMLSKFCKTSQVTVKAWIPIAQMRTKLPHYIKQNAVIAAVGGDGTISAVAAMTAGTGATMAPLPGGTLNHFTKDLGISQDIEQAIKNLNDAHVRTLDCAKVNGQVFINNSSIGLYPTSLRTRDRLEKKIGKWPSAVYAAFRATIRLRLFTVTIKGDTFKTPFIFVGNNVYKFDGVGVAARTKLDSGKLSVFVTKTSSRSHLLKIALLTLLGRARYIEEFDIYELDELMVKMKRRHVYISYDGEITRLKTPLEYSILKKSLKILS